MSHLSTVLFLFSYLIKIVFCKSSNFSIIQMGYLPCPCLRRTLCTTLPAYGESPLDIFLYGSHGHCMLHDDIRCCPRKGFHPSDQVTDEKEKWESRDESSLMAKTKLQQECGCIPKGLCHKGVETLECGGNFELCCVTRESFSQTELFNLPSLKMSNHAASKKRTFQRPSPVFRPSATPASQTSFSSMTTTSATPATSGPTTPKPKIDCVPIHECDSKYGDHVLDISLFGTLSPCVNLSQVLCVDVKGRFNANEARKLVPPLFNNFLNEKDFDGKNVSLLQAGAIPIETKPIHPLAGTHQKLETVISGETVSAEEGGSTGRHKATAENSEDRGSILKSIPPMIYVNENGTLIIDGGRPVVFLPTPPASPPIDPTTSISTSTSISTTTTRSASATTARPFQTTRRTTATATIRTTTRLSSTRATTVSTRSSSISSTFLTTTRMTKMMESNEATTRLTTSSSKTIFTAAALSTTTVNPVVSFGMNPVNNKPAAVLDSKSLSHSAVDFFAKISSFFLRQNETKVNLSNGHQSLNFTIERNQILNLINVFSDVKTVDIQL